MKPTGAGGIAPPERNSANKRTVFTEEKSENNVRITARIKRQHGVYLKILSAKTSRNQKDLMEEALEMLEEKYGSI